MTSPGTTLPRNVPPPKDIDEPQLGQLGEIDVLVGMPPLTSSPPQLAKPATCEPPPHSVQATGADEQAGRAARSNCRNHRARLDLPTNRNRCCSMQTR